MRSTGNQKCVSPFRLSSFLQNTLCSVHDLISSRNMSHVRRSSAVLTLIHSRIRRDGSRRMNYIGLQSHLNSIKYIGENQVIFNSLWYHHDHYYVRDNAQEKKSKIRCWREHTWLLVHADYYTYCYQTIDQVDFVLWSFWSWFTFRVDS